jgi:hypothetical protein
MDPGSRVSTVTGTPANVSGHTSAVTSSPVNRPAATVIHTRNGAEVRRSLNGEVHDVRVHGMEIHRAPSGIRNVTVQRRDHSVLVTNQAGHGYIQRPYTVRNQAFVSRTFYVRNTPYVRVYRPYSYRGVALHVYVPNRYYAPALYSWAYAPWVTPVVFRWGWVGNPWSAYYGSYFTPSPLYASPSLWLTDYVMAATLQAAYQERLDAGARLAEENVAATPLSADVKEAIADEVRGQLALENFERQTASQTPPDAGSSGIARLLADGRPHVFVVAKGLLVNSNVGECAISEGDVLQLDGSQPSDPTIANLSILASHGQDCNAGSRVAVQIADLQEMQNHMRETIDQGLGELHSNQAQGEWPAMPTAATEAPVPMAFAPIEPPDPRLASELQEKAREAVKAEHEALSKIP